MNREILFRGKRLDNDAWVHGCLLVYADGSCFICREYIPCKFNKLQVDPSTVGQYACMPDKNGKKIFEGDIIATPKYGVDNGKGQNYSGKDKFAVGYSDGTYTLENGRRRYCLRPDVDAVVCGNIYDNPELLV